MPTFYLCLVQRQFLARERINKASKNAVDVPLHVHRSFGCEIVASAAAATDTARIVVAVVLFFRVLYSFSFENEVTIIIIMLLLTQ